MMFKGQNQGLHIVWQNGVTATILTVQTCSDYQKD